MARSLFSKAARRSIVVFPDESYYALANILWEES